MIDLDIKEHEGMIDDVLFEVIVYPLQFTPVLFDEHPSKQEVRFESLIDISNNDVPSVDIPNRY